MSRYTIISNPERISLIRAAFGRIQTLAKGRGFTADLTEMASICDKNGLEGANYQTLYNLVMRKQDSYSGLFGIEVLYCLCKGYNIPLEAVFSVEVVKGMQEQVVEGKGSEHP